MTLSERLKESTKPLHDSAEGHNFQKLLANGLLPLADYSAYLEQLFLVHKALEDNIKNRSLTEQRLQQVIEPEQLQQPYLEADLKFLGVNHHAVRALPATANFIEKIERQAEKNPISLLGFHYVLLGSKHGGKFIAKNLKQKYGFEEAGTKYFDPYGDAFMQKWRNFIDALNRVAISESENSSIIEAAQETFKAVSNVGSDLESRLTEKAV